MRGNESLPRVNEPFIVLVRLVKWLGRINKSFSEQCIRLSFILRATTRFIASDRRDSPLTLRFPHVALRKEGEGQEGREGQRNRRADSHLIMRDGPLSATGQSANLCSARSGYRKPQHVARGLAPQLGSVISHCLDAR